MEDPNLFQMGMGWTPVYYLFHIISPKTKVKFNFDISDWSILALKPIVDVNQWRIQDYRSGLRQTQRGAPTYYLTNFSLKLHENEDIVARARVPRCQKPGDQGLHKKEKSTM